MKKTIYIFLFLFSIQFSFGQWNTERIMNIGRNALAFEDFVLSIQYFNQVIKLKPYMAEPYMYRGMAKVSLGDYQGAEQDLNEAININPFVPQAYYARGYALKNLNRPKEAISDFNKALEFSPNNSIIVANLIDAKEKDKDFAGAMEEIERYRRLEPVKAKGLDYELARLLLEQKDTVAAISALERFNKADTVSFYGYSTLAFLKMLRKDEKGAYLDYSEAIKRKSNYFGDYINRGVLNVQKNNFNEALSDYNNAVKYDQKSMLAYYNRGLLRANLGDNNNAISDLSKVVEMDTTNYEAKLQKGYLQMKVRDYNGALKEFNTILKKYPYFVPLYYSIADIYKKQGRRKEAEQYRYLAFQIENNKDYYKRKQNLIVKNRLAMEQRQLNKQEKVASLMDKFSNDITETQTDAKYSSPTRGNVQNKFTELTAEKNFVISYYSKENELRQTNTYYPVISQYNGERNLPAPLKLTSNEIALTPDIINSHFEKINELSGELSKQPEDADLFFARALEFTLVQDYNSAIDDLNKVIQLRPQFMLAYFTRGNVRYKLMEFTKQEKLKEKLLKTEIDNKYEYEMISNDYDKTMDLNNDFSFAYYNKANIFLGLKEYQKALKLYTKAIEINPDFAEAYFNRGLTYLYLNNEKSATSDISKSGELGIVKSYNILKRLQENPKQP